MGPTEYRLRLHETREAMPAIPSLQVGDTHNRPVAGGPLLLSLVTAVLVWLHIFSAIGWMGAAMVFGMVLGPLLPTFNPATRGEVVVRLFPKYVRFAEIFSIMTVTFGFLTAMAFSGGDLSKFSPATTWGLFISTGATLGIIAFLISIAVIVPVAHKLVRLTQDAMKNPGPPSPDLQKASSRLKSSATLALVVMILVLVCMVAAAEF